MRPTFIIIGAQKAGTTSLWYYLRSHQDVFLPDNKEPGFFAEEFGWRKGLAWYESLFRGAAGYQAVGEASTYYSMYPFFAGVPRRMSSLIPDIRIIYVMRDPIERMRSAYMQLLADGRERRPMREALLFDGGYAGVSRYAMQIEQYLDYFPRSQLLLLTAEDLQVHRAQTLAAVCAFLGISANADVDLGEEHNRSAGKRVPRSAGRLVLDLAARERLHGRVRSRLRNAMRFGLLSRPMHDHEAMVDEDLRQRLVDLVQPDVARLRRWMGPSFDGWGLLPTGRHGAAATTGELRRECTRPSARVRRRTHMELLLESGGPG